MKNNNPKKSPLSRHHARRKAKRVFFTVETLLLVILACVVGFLAGEASNKFDLITETVKVGRMHSDSIAARMDSLDAHVLALHEITETNRSRSHQIAVGAKIIRSARKSIDARDAARLARILYEEAEFNSTVEYPFLLAIVESESKFNANAVSPAGAIGLGQLMPKTAESMARHAGMKFDTAMLTDPKYNVKLCVQYLSKLGKQFQNYVLVAAAYNGGPGGAIKYQHWIEGEGGKENVHPETVDYVEKVMQRYYMYRAMLQ
jgi:soluble lytic murein transglycosylase-like protein